MPDADDERALALDGVAASAGTFALGPIDLRVEPGHVLVVLGPSGAGKTTLLDTIAGFLPARAGTVRLAGREITQLAPERRGIGIVFQHAALFPHLSVRENVRFGPRASGGRRPDRSDELLERFGLTAHAERRPGSLSGGERQRVGLARALAVQPDLLLLDEPLSALDQPTREELRGVLQELLSGLGIPAVHVTHDRDEALALADVIAVMAAGQLRQVGPALEVASRPADAEVARLLGWGVLGAGTVERGSITLGDLRLRAPAKADGSAAIVVYRPEALVLDADKGEGEGEGEVQRTVTGVLPTLPLARLTLAGDPPLTVLVLHRELERLGLRPGDRVRVGLPDGCVRVL